MESNLGLDYTRFSSTYPTLMKRPSLPSVGIVVIKSRMSYGFELALIPAQSNGSKVRPLRLSWMVVCIMTSSNGNIFRVTGPLCGEFTGHRWIPQTKASDALVSSLICAWINGWVNNREAGDLRRHRAPSGWFAERMFWAGRRHPSLGSAMLYPRWAWEHLGLSMWDNIWGPIPLQILYSQSVPTPIFTADYRISLIVQYSNDFLWVLDYRWRYHTK